MLDLPQTMLLIWVCLFSRDLSKKIYQFEPWRNSRGSFSPRFPKINLYVLFLMDDLFLIHNWQFIAYIVLQDKRFETPSTQYWVNVALEREYWWYSWNKLYHPVLRAYAGPELYPFIHKFWCQVFCPPLSCYISHYVLAKSGSLP